MKYLKWLVLMTALAAVSFGFMQSTLAVPVTDAIFFAGSPLGDALLCQVDQTECLPGHADWPYCADDEDGGGGGGGDPWGGGLWDGCCEGICALMECRPAFKQCQRGCAVWEWGTDERSDCFWDCAADRDQCERDCEWGCNLPGQASCET